MTFAAPYSQVDRLLHGAAFVGLDLQRNLGEVEDFLNGRKLKALEPGAPIFISSVARAGTTLLLQLLASVPSLASHSYREMPFVLCPLLWNSLAKRFRKEGSAVERAHGDGVLVELDSFEALEEVIWRSFWPEHYEADRIVPWTSESKPADDGFLEFFRSHQKKMILLRCPSSAESERRRYLSKNNGNIARLAYLRRHFRDAALLVPFRDPLTHARSLRQQHRNFLRLQADDAFVLRYMSDLGHFEFGGDLRPVDHGAWIERADGRSCDPDSLDFWLLYWTRSFQAVLDEASYVRPLLFSYERLCADPGGAAATLAEHLDLDRPDELLGAAGGVRSQTSEEECGSECDPALMREARETHERLLELAIN